MLGQPRDEATGKTEAKTVKRLFKRQVEATLVLSFSNGDKIECTKEHPFYVEHKGFTPAGELGIGTSIVTRAGPSAKLTHVQTKRETATVYNFEVEDFHSYFVGHDGLWVHNQCKFDLKKLPHHFKHALDFGILGNWNKANGEAFMAAIEDHIANTIGTPGTYRGSIAVTHHYDSGTGLWAAVDTSNNFVAGWKLSPNQATNLLSHGNIQ